MNLLPVTRVAVAGLLLALAACRQEDFDPGEVRSETRAVGAFDAIDVDGSADAQPVAHHLQNCRSPSLGTAIARWQRRYSDWLQRRQFASRCGWCRPRASQR